MQATMSYGYPHAFSAHATFYEPPLDTRDIFARYATSSCRDEPPRDPTAPKYDPLHILSPRVPLEPLEAVYHPTIILVTATKTPIDHKCTPRDPRAIGMAMRDPPHSLAWARDQGRDQQSIWALSALSNAQYPEAVNYHHYWGENARDATAAFVCGAMAHGLMRLEPTDPPADSPAELVAYVLRAFAEFQDANKPAVAEGTRASTRVMRQKREAEAAKERAEAVSGPSSVPKKRGSPHAPAVSSPLAQSMLLPPADIDMASEITRAAPRPAKKSKLARDAASVSADEAEPSSSASSDGTLVSSSAGSTKASRKRSRSGSASSSATTVDVVNELEGERPAKKPRRKTPVDETAGAPGEAAGKLAKAPKKRAPKKK